MEATGIVLTSLSQTKTVIVIGAGNIGRRHLQALLTNDPALELIVVEPSATARDETQSSLTELGVATDAYRFATFDELPPSADVAIVATTADVRRVVTEELLRRVSVPRLVLEKFLFQQPNDFEHVGNALSQAGAHAWVNTPRRAWPVYREVRDRITGTTAVRIDVSVPVDIGIASNAIHFLDLLSFLSRCVEFSLEGSALDPTVVDAKRAGAVEFTGALGGRGADGSEFLYRTEATDRIVVGISWAGERVQIDETNDAVTVLQSKLTDRIVGSLLETEDCELTPYAESARLHLAVLRPLLEHYRAVVDPRATGCPIT